MSSFRLGRLVRVDKEIVVRGDRCAGVLGEDFRDDLAEDIRQSKLPSLSAVSEAFVVDAK